MSHPQHPHGQHPGGHPASHGHGGHPASHGHGGHPETIRNLFAHKRRHFWKTCGRIHEEHEEPITSGLLGDHGRM